MLCSRLTSINKAFAWGNEDTKKILDILKKHNVKATFFMTGGWVGSFPEDVKAIAADGHDLGNHSENHKHMSQLSKQQCIDEIMKVHEKVKALTGKEMQLFRPPYGDYNNTLMEAIRDSKYYGIQWNCDSLDWKNYGVDAIVKTVCTHKNLGNGSIVLMHNGGSVIISMKSKSLVFQGSGRNRGSDFFLI